MTTTTESKAKRYAFEPDYAVPPGRTLQETIDALGMDQRELATRSGLSPKHINQIIQGDARITQETAIRLERVTGVPARLWNSLETNYREQLTRLDERKRMAHALAWLKEIPLQELIKRGKIQKQPDRVALLDAVLAFFGVADVEAWRRLWTDPQVAYRKSAAFRGKPGAMATWLRLGELEAQTIPCQTFDRATFRAALQDIRALTTEAPEVFVPKMQARCASTGVAVVFVPEMKGVPVSGATQWLTSDKALIQLSLRYKTNDQFWFSFFHEAGHILNGGKKDKFIDVDHEDGEEEDSANRFAANFLIPPEYTNQLPKLTDSRAIQVFARSIGIAPGIVVGRLQHDKIINYNQSNELKVRFSWR